MHHFKQGSNDSSGKEVPKKIRERVIFLFFFSEKPAQIGLNDVLTSKTGKHPENNSEKRQEEQRIHLVTGLQTSRRAWEYKELHKNVKMDGCGNIGNEGSEEKENCSPETEELDGNSRHGQPTLGLLPST